MSPIRHQLSAICILALGSLVAVSGQTLAPLRRPPLNEPLETSKNMPPAAPRKVETSPRKISQFGVFTSYQANVDGNGNNILGDAANEPSIAVDPTDANKMVNCLEAVRQHYSDFRQAGWGYTTDGGVTWTFPGVLQNNVFRSDPVTAFQRGREIFSISVSGRTASRFFATTCGAH